MAPTSPSGKRKAKAKANLPPSSIITFPNEESQVAARRRRARFNTERRCQVKGVRKRGACMRCRLMKIPCSEDDLCTTCLRAARLAHNHERHVLGFIGCVRTSLLDVSIFPHAIEKAFPSGIFLRTFTSDSNKNQGSPSEVPSVFYTFVHQLNNSNLISVEIPDTRISNLSQLSDDAIPEVVQFYTSLVLAISRGYFPQRMPFDPFAFSTVVLGQACLGILERQLKPSVLASRTKDDLRLLLLLTFGTALTVGFAEPILDVPPFPEEDTTKPGSPRTLYDVLRTHLCQMLAYYMTFIGSKLGLLEMANPNKTLKVKHLAESLALWEVVLLRWLFHWQECDFDRQWLNHWASLQADEAEHRLPGSAPLQEFFRHLSNLEA